MRGILSTDPAARGTPWRRLMTLLVAGMALLASPEAQPQSPLEADLLLKGGEVHDGTGARGRVADVAIRGDRIVFVGNAARAGVRAARTIDVAGLVVAPGFIDPHTHAGEDLSDPQKKSNVNYLMQGVTTVVVGNDGGGSPRPATTLERWEQQGIGTNALLLVGHGAVRREVLGPADVQPSAEQLEKMKALVREAIEQGAFGLSSGLYYTPGNYAKTEEVIALARVAAEIGGIYDTHMRDESSYSIGLLGSIDESIRIAREAKIHLNISHIKALGPEVWGQSKAAIARIRKARAQGLSITADQYPYIASGSNLASALLPPWVQAGTREEVRARLQSAELRPRLLKEMEENLKRRAGAGAILFRSRLAPQLVGKTLEQVAAQRGKPPVETALEILLEGDARGLGIVSFNMNEDDVERFMKEDFVMTGSDGSTGHPRMYGTYPRKLRRYVYERKILSLRAFVRRSSALPAETLRIPERGVLRDGYFADVAVFDPKTITDKATFEEPELLAVGMKYVLVNGRLVVENGAYNGALAGRALRKQPR